MGASNSSSVLTQDLLDEYILLTHLTKAEIINLYKLLGKLDEKDVLQSLSFRFPIWAIEELFPQIQCNPFRDRIFRVFSSQQDYCLSFEDVLDLCSVMSDKCPTDVKAKWAFKIFDFDEDDEIGVEDLRKLISVVTKDEGKILEDSKTHIIKILMDEMDVTSCGKIGQIEFVHAVEKMSDFHQTFCFRF